MKDNDLGAGNAPAQRQDWHWTAVVWDKDDDAHPIDSFRLPPTAFPLRRDQAEAAAAHNATRKWPNRRPQRAPQ